MLIVVQTALYNGGGGGQCGGGGTKYPISMSMSCMVLIHVSALCGVLNVTRLSAPSC